MTENNPQSLTVWFDLDDTLAYELDFCKSGFRAVAKFLAPFLPDSSSESEIELVMAGAAECKMNHYDALQGFLECIMFGKSEKDIEELVKQCVTVCRNHIPDSGYSLKEGVEEALGELQRKGITIGIITDGRDATQRNKFSALHLDKYVNDDRFLISEEFGSGKETEQIFNKAAELSGSDAQLYYIADNPAKDFLHPNRLGWRTVMIAPDRRNIHFPHPKPDADHAPQLNADSVADAVKNILNQK